MLHLFLLRREQRRLHEVTESIRAVIELSADSVDPYDRHRGQIARVMDMLCLAESSCWDDARSRFATMARHGFTDLARDPYWLTTIVLLADVAVSLDDRQHAQSLYELLLPYANRNTSPASSHAPFGSVSYYLGSLATLLARWDDAARHFESALEMDTRMQARPAASRSTLAYADTLLKRGAPGDRERAQELLKQALATSEELGLTRLIEQARALLASIGSAAESSHRSESPPHGLSERELDVLRLIVAGKSDREIADDLFISKRTVTTHVSNIFNKLGLNTRAEAAAFAVRHALA
jgi:DNA-binding CsgD family transcriptional regulator